jgi:chemotaxis protein MotD
MIDQLVSGPAQPVQAKGLRGDKQVTSDDRESGADSFDDLVSKAGKADAKGGKDEDGDQGQVKRTTGSGRLPDALSKVAFEVTSALRNTTQSGAQIGSQTIGQTAAQADGRIKLANQKDLLKTTAAAPKQDEHGDASLAKALDKALDKAKAAAKALEQAQDGSKTAAENEDEALTPADELGRLLGLKSSKETTGKREGKDAVEDTRNTADGDDDGRLAAAAGDSAKIDAKALEAAHRAMGDSHSSDTRSTDDRAGRNDTVRVVSADGRGRAVDVPISSKVTTETQKDDKTAAASKADVATVIEARRYLGFSADSNASTIANAAKAEPTWTSALEAVQRADLSGLGDTVKEVNTLKLQMNPEHLGNMVASLKLKGDELTVEVRVDSAEAYRHLSADQDDIVKALQDQGFSIDKVTVQLNATERTDTGADRDMARQQGQAQRESQDGQSGRNGARQDNQPRWSTQQQLPETVAVDRLSDTGRSGNIYL